MLNEFTDGPFQREDLIRLLYRLATAAGAIVHWNTEVVSVEQGSPNPSVTLANGEVLTANILIGADGCNSIVRAVVLGHDEPPEPAGLNVYSGMVKAEDIRNDPELSPYLTGVDVSASSSAFVHDTLSTFVSGLYGPVTLQVYTVSWLLRQVIMVAD